MVLKKEVDDRIKKLLQKNPDGLSITDIVAALNINRNTAGRYLENSLVSGQVEMRRFGMAKIYKLSRRVPFSAVLSISAESVIQLDSFLRIVFANEPFCTLVETDSRNLLGKSIEYTPIALVFDELFVGFIERIKEGIAGNEWSGEIELRSKNIIVSCRIAPTVFEDGRKGVSIILEDITLRRKAEQKLEESERQFRLLAENSLDMIGRTSPDFTHTYVSPAYTTTLGYLPEEVLGKRMDAFLHPDDVRIIKSDRAVLTPQHAATTIRVRLRHKDGHYLWVESAVRAIFDETTGELSEYYSVTRDITERKRMEEALVESEATARAFMNAPTDSVILLDSKGIILDLNDTAVSRFKKQKDDLIGTLADAHLPEEVARSRRLIISQVLETKQMVRFEDERDGRSYDTVAYPVIVDNNEVKSIAIVARDITDRKKAEQALLESEAKFRSVSENSRDWIMMTDTNLDIIYISRPITTTADTILGKSVYHFIPEKFHPVSAACFGQVLATGKQVQFSTEYYTPDRGTLYFQAVVCPVFEGEKITSLAINVRDVTGRKEAEDALRESEERYRQLVEISPDAVIIHQEGKVMFVNPAALRMLGAKDSGEILGKNVLDLVHPEFRDAVWKNIDKDLGGEPTPSMKLRMLRVDGSAVDVEGRGVKTTYNNRPAIQVAIRDRE